MCSTKNNDPVAEEQWCNDRRVEVAEYLSREGVVHGRIGEWPAWHVAPYVSVWAIESLKSPGWVGWWVICGDMPTDYVSAKTIKHPRAAIKSIAERWLEISEYMERGQKHPTINIGNPDNWPKLAPLLKARSLILEKWANDDNIWVDLEQ